jgi:hypothetical protein
MELFSHEIRRKKAIEEGGLKIEEQHSLSQREFPGKPMFDKAWGNERESVGANYLALIAAVAFSEPWLSHDPGRRY